MRVVDLSRRSFAAAAALFLTARPNTPAFAALSGGAASVEEQYKAGARADGGRGAAALVKPRSQSGIDRVGGSPMFKPGSILDAMRSEDKTIVDVSFAYPDKWTVSNGPNLDVRDIANSDSAFLLVTPLKGKSIADVKMKFFTDLIFDPAGKYGSYGTVDDFKTTDAEVVELTSPAGAAQKYRRFKLRFDALTYNQNTVSRTAYVSATSAGGSAFVLIAGCLSKRAKEAGKELTSIQKSFRVNAADSKRAEQILAEAAAIEEKRLADAELDIAGELKTGGLFGGETVGATSGGRIGYRYEP